MYDLCHWRYSWRCAAVFKYVEYVSLEEVADKPAWQGRLAYRAKALRLREPYVICIMDQ